MKEFRLKAVFSTVFLARLNGSHIVRAEMHREVEIINEMGLHARPAAEFVRCVQQFQSEVIIHKNEEQFNANSILEVLSACLDCGTRVTLHATGPDEEEALNRLAELLLKFKEEEESSGH